jgi:hypothetical protein
MIDALPKRPHRRTLINESRANLKNTASEPAVFF